MHRTKSSFITSDNIQNVLKFFANFIDYFMSTYSFIYSPALQCIADSIGTLRILIRKKLKADYLLFPFLQLGG